MIHVLVMLVVIGVVMYLVNNVIPMVGWMKTVINAIVILIVLLWILQLFGIHTGIVPRTIRFGA